MLAISLRGHRLRVLISTCCVASQRARKLRPVRAAQIGMVYLPGSASPLTGWLSCVAASMREAGLDAAVQPLGLAPPGGSKTQKRGDKERADGDQLWGAFTTTSKSLSSLQKASRRAWRYLGACRKLCGGVVAVAICVCERCMMWGGRGLSGGLQRVWTAACLFA
eukprot:256871-Pleurochrysis_carterae.AAC.1